MSTSAAPKRPFLRRRRKTPPPQRSTTPGEPSEGSADAAAGHHSPPHVHQCCTVVGADGVVHSPHGEPVPGNESDDDPAERITVLKVNMRFPRKLIPRNGCCIFAYFEAEPNIVHPFGGIASQDGFTTMCVTTPNTPFIPEYPVERRIIKTYSDGRWGVHEYSRWPQLLVDGMWHIACIPRRDWALLHRFREILWRWFKVSDWVEDPTAAVASLGFLKKLLVDDLDKAAKESIAKYQAIKGVPPHRMEYGLQLIVVLRQCLDRVRLLASGPAVAIAVAAHVQRLALELEGLTTYLTVILPRIESHEDFKFHLLDVVGTFVKEGTAAATCVRIGLPVWFLQPLTRKVPVWHIVSVKRFREELSDLESSLSILHRAEEFAGMMNLTGNWSADMVVRISRDLCSSTLPDMSPPTSLEITAGPPEAKRSRAESSQMAGKQLEMPVRLRPAGKSGTSTGTKKVHRGGQRPQARGLIISAHVVLTSFGIS